MEYEETYLSFTKTGLFTGSCLHSSCCIILLFIVQIWKCVNLVAVLPVISSILSHSSSSEAKLMLALSNATVFICIAVIYANYVCYVK